MKKDKLFDLVDFQLDNHHGLDKNNTSLNRPHHLVVNASTHSPGVYRVYHRGPCPSNVNHPHEPTVAYKSVVPLNDCLPSLQNDQVVASYRATSCSVLDGRVVISGTFYHTKECTNAGKDFKNVAILKSDCESGNNNHWYNKCIH